MYSGRFVLVSHTRKVLSAMTVGLPLQSIITRSAVWSIFTLGAFFYKVELLDIGAGRTGHSRNNLDFYTISSGGTLYKTEMIFSSKITENQLKYERYWAAIADFLRLQVA